MSVESQKAEPVAVVGPLLIEQIMGTSLREGDKLYAAPVDAKAIRAEALEEAAKVCDEYVHPECWAAKDCAAAIRGLK